MTIKGEIVTELLKRFPKAPILTLGKKAYKENPKVFKDIEDARSTVRYHVGQNKNQQGKYGVSDKSHVREKEYNYNPFNLPESYADPFELFHIKDRKTIVLADPHFPYQDNFAITTALNYGKDRQPNCIFLNGDVIDFAPISKHEKDWRQRSVAQEFEAVRAFLLSLRRSFPRTRIVYKLGNHDERWEKWLTVKAPELLDCKDFELEILLRFGEYGVEVVKDKRIVMVGNLPVLHGHELQGGGGINPGRATFLKTHSTALIAHVHKRSTNEAKTLLGEHIQTQSMGCLCGLYPKYMRINQWTHGLAYIEQDKSGEYELENLKIINGKIYK